MTTVFRFLKFHCFDAHLALGAWGRRPILCTPLGTVGYFQKA